jgi:hypothetical protein
MLLPTVQPEETHHTPNSSHAPREDFATGLKEITREIADFLKEASIETGLLTLFCRPRPRGHSHAQRMCRPLFLKSGRGTAATESFSRYTGGLPMEEPS